MFYKKLFELSLAFMVLVLWLSFTTGPSIESSQIYLPIPNASLSTVWAENEKKCLSQVIWAEARGEPLEGQLAVAIVVLNRSLSGKYPFDVCKVARQPGQFSTAKGRSSTSDAVTECAIRWYGSTTATQRSWLYFNRSHKGGTRIGAHRFYA